MPRGLPADQFLTPFFFFTGLSATASTIRGRRGEEGSGLPCFTHKLVTSPTSSDARAVGLRSEAGQRNNGGPMGIGSLKCIRDGTVSAGNGDGEEERPVRTEVHVTCRTSG